jgi:hypothetical protein
MTECNKCSLAFTKIFNRDTCKFVRKDYIYLVTSKMIMLQTNKLSEYDVS